MKKKIVVLILVFSAVNTLIYAQSATESKSNNNSVSVYPVGKPVVSERMVNIEQKRQLTPKDYRLWETVTPKKVSNNGEWVAYSMDYATGKDTLFVKNTNNGYIHTIAGGNLGTFSAKNDCFAYLIKNKGIGYLDLRTGRQTLVPEGIRLPNFTNDGRYLSILKTNGTKEPEGNSLLVKDLLRGTTIEIENVLEYSFNGKGDKLAYITQNQMGRFVALRHLDKDIKPTEVISSSPTRDYYNLVWDKEGKTFAFLEAFKDPEYLEESHIIHHYRSNKLYSFDHRKIKDFPQGMYISRARALRKFIISKDTQRVFFGIVPWTLVKNHNKKIKDKATSSNVQVWYSKDKEIYPKLKYIMNHQKPMLSVWWPSSGRFMQITDSVQSEAFLSGDQKHALIYDPLQYRPLFKYVEDYIDIYITDLDTGKKELFLKKQLDSHFHTVVSPGGKYINYFKDKGWWVYDIKAKTHINITKKLPHPSYQLKSTKFRSPQPFGRSTWIANDKAIIIQDQYDAWLISPDGSIQKQLTHGRASKTEHRVYEYLYTVHNSDDFFGHESRCFNPKEDILFSLYGETTKKSGYASWNSKEGYREIVYKDKHVDQLKKAKNISTFMVREQNFDEPPKLSLYANNGNIKKTIVQSNLHHWDYHWGRSELIQYSGINADTLQGVLFYPANYQASKKYPMVVSIYENKSQELHHYVNPSLQMRTGFNLTNFTINDYFVLYPDITYKYNDPGISATQCVVSAVEKVLEMGLVDKKAIGLRGHSFGGYETSFIITQTDLFTAAIASAAHVDLVSSYLSIYMGKHSEAEFFENFQFRFTGSFWQYPGAYLRNSPIHNLQKVTTPLLSWHGKKDPRVNFQQGIEMYNAMRRLGKEHIFLVYPDGNHLLTNTKDQIDLTKKTMMWFDYKLKGETGTTQKDSIMAPLFLKTN